MFNPQRLEFITRHFGDLQTIRFAPVPMAMLLAPAIERLPHLSRGVAWGMLLVFLVSVGGFYWFTTLAIRRRYGSVKGSRDEAQRMDRHPIMAALRWIVLAVLIWSGFSSGRPYFSDLLISSSILIVMLMTILDHTNPAKRRIVWASGLVILFAAGPFIAGLDRGAAIFCLTGSVWLSVSIFDFLLLRRTLAEISGFPSVAIGEVAMRHD